MKRSETNNWLFALMLSLPIIIFFLGYLFIHDGYLSPTGFIQYDNVSYIAYGKQYLDADNFHWQYSNPFHNHESKPVYFQPQTLLFAFLLKTGIPAGWILIPFTLVCSVICFRIMISIYDLLIKENKFRTFHIWLLCWGGGLLVAAGIIARPFLELNGSFFDDVFVLDPEQGWWGLNLGRALIFSCEAYYHALFLGCIFFLLKRNWRASLLLMFLLLFSHPFTGIELIGIVCFWVFVEIIIMRKPIPVWFALGALSCLLLYIYYYFIYLNMFPEHRSVAEQYSLGWRLGLYRMIPAYCLVAGLAIASIYQSSLRKFFQIPSNRLFACWFIIAFLLANHEVFMRARQPIHFTRGYIWTSLILLGLPALVQLTHFLKTKSRKLGIALLAIIFFTDNFLWITNNVVSKAKEPSATYIDRERQEMLDLLNTKTDNHSLIISNDEIISYLSTIYTRAYPWLSHPYTTPFVERKRKIYLDFINAGILDSSWMGRKIVFVFQKNSELKNMQPLVSRIFADEKIETKNYLMLECDSLHLRN